MIPKIIHYVWVGGAKLPDNIKVNIESWRKFCPDYEIKEWNESNFDINQFQYTKEAYANKKWAFVADFIRLKAVNDYGGIYLDTDVELACNLDNLLDNNLVLGFESHLFLGPHFIAAKKGNAIINGIAQYYQKISFLNADGTVNLATIPVNLTLYILKQLKRHILIEDNYEFADNIKFFKREYFSPNKLADGKFDITTNTYAIHKFYGSWTEPIKIKRLNKFLLRTRLFFANRFWRVFGSAWSIRKFVKACDKAYNRKTVIYK